MGARAHRPHPPGAHATAGSAVGRSARSAVDRAHRSAGFTLIELIMVIAIVGALAVFAMPRLMDQTSWRLQAFGDELRAQSMAMQRLALVQRRPVVATVTPTGVDFAYQGGGTIVSLPCPASASPCIAETGSRSVTFNAGNSGATATSTGVALPVTVSAAGTTTAWQYEAETGLFRPAP
jgi:prepilin-type N-terminal cleavage/methylation domain-containing protein